MRTLGQGQGKNQKLKENTGFRLYYLLPALSSL